jgi:hypothetical protein
LNDPDIVAHWVSHFFALGRYPFADDLLIDYPVMHFAELQISALKHYESCILVDYIDTSRFLDLPICFNSNLHTFREHYCGTNKKDDLP